MNLSFVIEEKETSIIIDVVGYNYRGEQPRTRTKLHTIDIFHSVSKLQLIIDKKDVLGDFEIERELYATYIKFGKEKYTEFVNSEFSHVSYDDIIICDLVGDKIRGIEFI